MEEKLLKDIDPLLCKYYIDHEGNLIVESSFHILQDENYEHELKEWFSIALIEFKRRVDLFNENQKGSNNE